jgi:hypothetical protein
MSDENSQWYNGYDVSLNARFPGGGAMLFGLSSGLSQTMTCEVDNPNSLRFCDQGLFDVPFGTQVKLSGTYPLPLWDLSVSGVFQTLPGAERTINYTVTRAVVPTLTQSSVVVRLNEPGTSYYERLNQLDIRFDKMIRWGTRRITPQVAIFNATNSNTVLTMNNAYGSSLDQVQDILSGRIVRFGVQVDF